MAGASTAILLKRGKPDLRILVVDKTDRFDWKVGESTVEVSAYFLTRVLKQYRHLSQDQLPKQAFRFWFHNDDVTCLQEASETGPTQLARTPSFQLDRSKLDEHLLKVAGEEGSEVWRPAKVTAWTLGEGSGPNTLTIEKSDGTTAMVSCRWLVDATGRQAMLARKRGGVTPIDTHPTAAIWVRYRDVPDMDGVAIAGTDPGNPWSRAVLTARPAGDQPLHRVGLLDLVHSAQGRRDERRTRLGQEAADARRQDPSREADALPRGQPALATAHPGRHADRGRLPLLRASALLRRQVRRTGLGAGGRRGGLSGSVLLAGPRPDVLLGLDADAPDPEGLRRRATRGDGEGVRRAQPQVRPFLQVLLRVDLPRQVLRDGRLRHDDGRIPARHGPLLLRRGHADLPLVARAARDSALLRGRRGNRLLPDPLLQPSPRQDRAAQDGARHLRQSQRRDPPEVRRLLGPQRDVGHAVPRSRPLGEGGARQRLDARRETAADRHGPLPRSRPQRRSLAAPLRGSGPSAFGLGTRACRPPW